jgi:hypothetical protein
MRAGAARPLTQAFNYVPWKPDDTTRIYLKITSSGMG